MNRLIAFFCAALVALLPVESFAQQVSGPTTTAVTQSAGNSSSKIANTAFVGTAINNAIAGINPAVAVQAATTAAGNTSAYTYNNGASGIGATLTGVANTALTVDGYTFTAVGQRLLVKNDTQSPSGAFNGVYSVTQVQTGILPLILTRALDYDMPSDINNTGAIPVQNGTVNGSTSYVITSQVTTVGTDPLTFTQFSLNPTTVVVGPASATDGNLAVFNGTSGKLVKDGGAVPVAAFAKIACTSPSATTTVTFSSIPGTYSNLELKILGNSQAAATTDTLTMRFNGDSGANYDNEFIQANTSTVTGSGSNADTGIKLASVVGSTGIATGGTPVNIEIPGYAQTSLQKGALSQVGLKIGTSNVNQLFYIGYQGTWRNTAAITSIALILGSNWTSGSVACLYGLN